MIRVRQISILVEKNTPEYLLKECARKLKINSKMIKDYHIHKQSIDARKKPTIYYIYELDVDVLNEKEILLENKSNDILKTPLEKYEFKITGDKKMNNRPVIVGSGPAGLFCAYMLAKNHYKPIIIERGEALNDRLKSVECFWKTGKLNKNSNVQFGEGGAGTFSDGKLNTQVKDKYFRGKEVLDIFVDAGADKSIKYINKPHIGTDLLRGIIKNIRNKIIEMGGEFRYSTCLTDININNNKVESIIVNNKEEIPCEVLILAIGHSARDTFYMLKDRNLSMEAKPFAVGIRIQHKQELININQYGTNNKLLGPASYKLVYKSSNNRGVYSFCMCPGGFVVNSSSEENKLAINGMSNHDRGSENANSAIVVTIGPDDFGTNPLDGIVFQRNLEDKCYKIGGGKIPIQLFKDYKLNEVTKDQGTIEPIFKGEYIITNINNIFPNYINESLKEGINAFGKKIKGFNADDAIIAAVESRTSSPVRIVRSDTGESSIKGIYPCGEGAGYAGGITSAAMDGLKIAEDIAGIYKSL